MRLYEMAMHRDEAIDRCLGLGKQFINHFKETYLAGLDDKDFNHHCVEMQTWYDDVKSIELKPRSKHLQIDQIIDWFFTAGSSIEYLFKDNEAIGDIYEIFVRKVIFNNDIKKAFEEILNPDDNP